MIHMHMECDEIKIWRGPKLDFFVNIGFLLPECFYFMNQLFVPNYLTETYCHWLDKSAMKKIENITMNFETITYCLWRSGFISLILIISLQQESK